MEDALRAQELREAAAKRPPKAGDRYKVKFKLEQNRLQLLPGPKKRTGRYRKINGS